MDSPNQSARNLSRLPEDIIFNILTWLPAQELKRLKIVSKSWFSIIKSPAFINAQLHNAKPGLLRDVRLISSDTLKLPTKEHDDIVPIREFTSPNQYIWGSCNGLVLYGSFDTTQGQLFLKNPVTQEMIELPFPTRAHSSTFDHVFGMTYMDHVFGVTYMASVNEIRVLHYFTSSHFLGCQTLTLGHDKWELVDHEETSYLSNSSQKIIFIDDVAHWAGLENCSGDYKVLSYDMNEQEFYLSKIPEGCIEVFDVGGVLAVIRKVKGVDNKFEGFDNKFEVWVLKDLQKRNWVIQQVIKLEGVYTDLSAVTTIDHGKTIIFKHYDPTIDSDLCFAYDILLKQTTYLDYRNSGDVTLRLLPHIDSLVSCSSKKS